MKRNNNLLKCKLSYHEEWHNVPHKELHFYYAQEQIKSYYKGIKKIVDQIITNIDLNDEKTKKLISHLYLKINNSFQNFKRKFGKSLEDSKLKDLEIDDIRFLIQYYIQKLLKYIELNY